MAFTPAKSGQIRSAHAICGLAMDRYDFCRKYARKELKQAATFDKE
jgi:hypothetical protein